jgi:hypothetical protein
MTQIHKLGIDTGTSRTPCAEPARSIRQNDHQGETMKSIIKVAAPAVFALTALSVNAQTIETDYPHVVPAGPVIATVAPVESVAGQFAYGQDAPQLLQSNAEGPSIDPAYAAANASMLTRDEVQARAAVRVRWNAPDRRS